MEAKLFDGLKFGKEDAKKVFDKELMKVRRVGVSRAELSGVPNLRLIAKAITPGGTPRQELEALLELLIAGKFAEDQSRAEQMRLTFGLHEDTRGASSADRHKAAWRRHEADPDKEKSYTLDHYETNRTAKYRMELVLEVVQVCRANKEAIAKATGAPLSPKSVTSSDTRKGPPIEVDQTTESPPPVLPAPTVEPSRTPDEDRIPRRRKRWLVVLGAAAVVLIATVVAITSPFAGDTADATHDPSLRQLATEDDRLLPLPQTPLPGEASRMLGYGDEVGGRKMYAYAGNRNYTTLTPTLDSIDDAPSQYPNGRKFVHVLIVSRKHIHHVLDHEEPRSAALPLEEGKLASVRVWIENSAAMLGPCHSRQPTTAAEVKLRIAIWESADHTLHVVRAWLSSRNAEPRWITDAVAVKTPQAARLVLVPALSTYWLRQTGGRYPFPAVNAFKPAGVAIGVDGTGRIGSCWAEDLNYNLVFRPEAVTH